MAEAIRVEGLRELQRNLKQLSADLPKVLRIALNEAADIVVTTARLDVPQRSGKAAATIKARSTRTEVRVSGGGNRAPYYPWLDFGGRAGRNKKVRRAFLPDGRYIYAAYGRKRDSGEFADVLSRALVDVAAQAGMMVT